MCGFCGLFGVQRHWTAGPASADMRSRHARRELSEISALVLRYANVRVVPWQTQFKVSGPTGREILVSDLAAVWREADRVAPAAIDPLDEAFLDRLERPDDQ